MQIHAKATFLQSELLPKLPLKPRARLAVLDAVEIFKLRGSGVQATELANIYGVSEKTIRDIWTNRTWTRETWHLEPSRQVVLKQTGRPKGRTDSRPRRPKIRVDHLRMEQPVSVCTSMQPFEDQYWTSADSTQFADDAQSPLPCAFQLDSTGGARHDVKAPALPSLDEQLGAWDLEACSPESWDPFEQDWARARAGLAMCAV